MHSLGWLRRVDWGNPFPLAVVQWGKGLVANVEDWETLGSCRVDSLLYCVDELTGLDPISSCVQEADSVCDDLLLEELDVVTEPSLEPFFGGARVRATVESDASPSVHFPNVNVEVGPSRVCWNNLGKALDIMFAVPSE